MKKIIAILLSVVLLLSLCACSGASSASKRIMKYVDNKYKTQEYSSLNGDVSEIELILDIGFNADKPFTMYSAVEDDTYIAIFDVPSEDFDLSQYVSTANLTSAYFADKDVDNELFFTYSPKNKVLFAVHNGEDITSNYN